MSAIANTAESGLPPSATAERSGSRKAGSFGLRIAGPLAQEMQPMR